MTMKINTHGYFTLGMLCNNLRILYKTKALVTQVFFSKTYFYTKT